MVIAAEEYYKNGRNLSGKTGIETISASYETKLFVWIFQVFRFSICQGTEGGN
jgi:hypothetical protein